MTDGPAHRRGDDPTIRTVFVASCPGRREESAGRPLAGRSGQTLRAALEGLREAFGEAWFPSLRLEDYTLTNAWERVEYPALTGRAEPTSAEVMSIDNIASVRARTVEAGLTHVVALGSHAREVAMKLGATAILAGSHPSPQHVNRGYKSDKPTAAERNADRIRQWATRLREVT